TNSGDTPVMIRVEALRPAESELRSSSDPIEDAQWIIVRPSTQMIAPHAVGKFDVILLLPNESRLRHRKFQAMIWSHTEPMPGEGITMRAGLKSRLRFTTEP